MRAVAVVGPGMRLRRSADGAAVRAVAVIAPAVHLRLSTYGAYVRGFISIDCDKLMIGMRCVTFRACSGQPAVLLRPGAIAAAVRAVAVVTPAVRLCLPAGRTLHTAGLRNLKNVRGNFAANTAPVVR